MDDKQISNPNIKFGWLWLLIGLLEAAWIGMHAFEPDWLGGYASLTRRFLRLSHIAFMALAIVNIVYGLCLPQLKVSRKIKKIGSYSMILAGIFMPLICLLCVYKIAFKALFFLPVVFFLTALTIMLAGQFRTKA